VHVPSQSWNRGSWNLKLKQFNSLGRMVGLGPNPSSGELDATIKKVSSAKVFAESITAFIEEVAHEKGMTLDEARAWVLEELEHINKKLGLMEPLPFMSMNEGFIDPASFNGIALWPPGITNWAVLRHSEIVRAHKAGAKFEKVIVMWSSRKCDAPADLRHPYIRDRYEEGEEPTERKLMQDIIDRDAIPNLVYEFAQLPKAQAEGRPLSLQHQLEYFISSGQYEYHFAYGYDKAQARSLYVPSTPNSLYVPLHVKRVLGHSDVAFSQAGARLVPKMPGYYWESLQEILTTPNGIFRLWIELRNAGCITD
jgi:hypothetical protein